VQAQAELQGLVTRARALADGLQTGLGRRRFESLTEQLGGPPPDDPGLLSFWLVACLSAVTGGGGGLTLRLAAAALPERSPVRRLRAVLEMGEALRPRARCAVS
jgi:hypothetical protein